MSVMSIPEDDKQYWVTVRIADHEWSTGMPKSAKKKYNRYNSLLTENNDVIRFPYSSIEDIGTVFVYLNMKTKISGDKRICYWKGSIMEFAKPNPDLRWLQLTPDLAIDEV